MKCCLEFFQGSTLTKDVANATRGRRGLFRCNLKYRGGSAVLGSAIPIWVIVPLCSIVTPLKGLKVHQLVVATFCLRPDVIDVPPLLARDIPIFQPAYQVPASIPADGIRIASDHRNGFTPYGPSNREIKISPIFVFVIHLQFFCWFILSGFRPKAEAALGINRQSMRAFIT